MTASYIRRYFRGPSVENLLVTKLDIFRRVRPPPYDANQGIVPHKMMNHLPKVEGHCFKMLNLTEFPTSVDTRRKGKLLLYSRTGDVMEGMSTYSSHFDDCIFAVTDRQQE